jgi:DNA-directed RNA polymerase subunit M/transcription elongation factor TFIIS
MSSPTSTRMFACDGCQATLSYDPAHAGTKCRCGKCGKVLTVPAAEQVPEPPPSPPKQDYVEFWCQKCDTRLVALSIHAGKKAKCTECGAINIVPAPKAIPTPRIPPAMKGPQYDVWEVNKAPEPQAQRDAQPTLFPVYCRVCDTLMYAQPKHVGAQLKCPDCGALTKVKEPPKVAPKKSPLVPAGQEYQLDPNHQIAPSVTPEYIDRITRASRVAAEEAAKKREEERPPMPPLPTINGVWSMLLSDPIPTWLVGTSVLGMVVAGLLTASITGAQGGGFTQVFALMCRIFGLLAGLLWIAPTAAILCAITSESSEGFKKLHASPSPYFFESFMEPIYIFFSLGLSLIPGFSLMRFVPWQYSFAVGAVSFLIFFPVLLLSAFQQSTPMGVFSVRVWQSLALRPGHWLLFYVESAVIWAIGGAIIAGYIMLLPEWPLGVVPIVHATAFVYFRVLGRFAWWLSESLPAEDVPSIEPRYKRFD